MLKDSSYCLDYFGRSPCLWRHPGDAYGAPADEDRPADFSSTLNDFFGGCIAQLDERGRRALWRALQMARSDVCAAQVLEAALVGVLYGEEYSTVTGGSSDYSSYESANTAEGSAESHSLPTPCFDARDEVSGNDLLVNLMCSSPRLQTRRVPEESFHPCCNLGLEEPRALWTERAASEDSGPDWSDVRYLPLDDITWRIPAMARQPVACKQLLTRVENANPSERQVLLLSLLPDALSLANDAWGMKVIQSLFVAGRPAQQWLLAQQFAGHVLRTSLMSTGCRVIQAAIEAKEPRTLDMIGQELHGHVMELVEDQNGNHVLQKFIENAPLEALSHIVYVVRPRTATLSVHCFGCRVVQRLLERRHAAQAGNETATTATKAVLKELALCTQAIVDKAAVLSLNQFGNYVMQHVLHCGTTAEKKQLLQILKNALVAFSTQKFACNVIEKALQLSDQTDRNEIASAALQGAPAPLSLLMPDRYGNYVAQRMLEVSTSPVRERLIELVNQNADTLAKTPYGKHTLLAAQQLPPGASLRRGPLAVWTRPSKPRPRAAKAPARRIPY